MFVGGKEKKLDYNTKQHSAIARSLVLAGHLVYVSMLEHTTNMVLWSGTCPARPGLHYTTETTFSS